MKKTLPKYLKREQAEKLLAAPYETYPEHKIGIWLGLHGLRASEIINIQVRDIDIEKRILIVRQGKGGKDRIVPIGPDLSNYLRKHIEKYELSPADKLVNMTRQNLYRMIRRYGRLTGIEQERGGNISVHMLRHTFAVQSLRRGIDLRVLQKVLGHSNINRTAIYLDLVAEDIQNAYRERPLPW